MYRKYHNKKVRVNGKKFDSKKEGNRYIELKKLEAKGCISNLQTQVKFVLIPSQYESYTDSKGKEKKKCVERECAYIADFVYDYNGQRIVEDTKGFRTPEYVIKRKLMRKIYGIAILEN